MDIGAYRSILEQYVREALANIQNGSYAKQFSISAPSSRRGVSPPIAWRNKPL